jgi:protein-S-isoprenylcysteine O-methyltransferase Ste14
MSDATARPQPSRARWLIRILIAAGAGAVIGARLPRLLGGPAGAGAHAASGLPGFTIPVYVSIALWFGFSFYWTWASKNASVAAHSETRASRLVHLVIVSAGQLLVLVPMPGLRGRLWPEAWPIAGLGLAVNVAAVALAVWARRTLGKHWSGEITTKVDHDLITSGPYAYVRHPIYSAVLGLCVGTTLVWNQWHAVVGTLLVAIAYVRKIRLEEENLSEAFGPAWDEYRARVKGLVPGVF